MELIGPMATRAVYQKLIADAIATIKREISLEAGFVLRKALADAAPKHTMIFAAGIGFRITEPSVTKAVIDFEVAGEHAYVWPFLRDGTRKHLIPIGGAAAQMAKGYPLHFYWPNGFAGPGWYSFWKVNHPGTKPNPFVEVALQLAWPEVKRRGQDIIGQVLSQLQA